MKIPTHRDVLTDAKKWRTDNNAQSRADAAAVLTAGMARYPDALALGE